MQPLRCMCQQVTMLVHRTALDRNVRPERRQGRVEAGTAIDDDQFRRLQAPLDEIVEQRPPGRFASLSPPIFFTANSTFLPSRRTPMATRREIDVALLSSLTRTTVPSRMRRMIGSLATDRLFQPSQSPLTLRHVRLTMSLPTPLANTAARARRPSATHPSSCARWSLGQLRPPRVGPGQIGRGDQCLSSLGAALVRPATGSSIRSSYHPRQPTVRGGRRSRSARMSR